MVGELGIILAVLSLIGMGVYPVFLKKVVKELGEYTCLLFNYAVLLVFLVITAVFTIKLTMPSDFGIGSIIIGAIVGVAAIYMYYKAINTGNVSIVTLIAATNVIWSVVASYFLFNERLTVIQYVAIAVILVGALLAAMEKISLPKKLDQKHFSQWLKSDVWSKGAGLALMVSLCWGFYNLVIKYNVREMGPHKAIVYMETLLMVLLLFAFIARPVKKLVNKPSKEQLRWLLPSGLLFTLGALMLYFAMSAAPLSFVIPIVNASPIATVIAAAILLRERAKVHQYIGIVVGVAGIVVLSL